MTLSATSRLGPYEVTAPLGAGGMGEVYRATDTRLGREVAIKVLPAEVAGDTERLARFEREAKLLASLNHPNIAHVYGFESATLPDGASAHFLAMELVEGEDLAQRVKRGPIPVDEALAIAKQIAEALEEAHEHGIVHRDLKPANVKVTLDGKVKVLDFGLAKAYAGELASGSAPDLSQSPTLAHTGTQAGVILGTAGYMSPEQARGRAVDKRADVWAFGVVLFEMLTGRRLFGGETASEILASVIKDEPAWEPLPTGLPSGVVGVLRRCLVKEPSLRLHDMADVRLLMAETEPPAPQQRAGAAAPRWREALAWLLAIAGLGSAGILGWRLARFQPAEPLTQFSVPVAGEHSVAFLDVPVLALSRDGRKLAFAVSSESGPRMIHVRAFDEPEARPLPGSEGGEGPFFSPDGSSLGFFADGRLRTVSLGGGPVVTVAEAPTHRGGAWGPGGTILFSPEFAAGLWRVPAAGGVAQAVLLPEADKGERTYRWPEVLPDGSAVIFTVGSLDSPNDYDSASVVAYSFATKQRHLLVKGASMARFLPPDTLVYARAGVLFAVAIDVDRLEPAGQPAPVLEGVAGDASSGASFFALAADGTLAAVRGTGPQSNRLLTLVDRKGEATQLAMSARSFRHPRFSPDGTRIAFTVGASATGSGIDSDVWVYSLATESVSRLTFEGRAYPLWSPDGMRIAYADPRQQSFLTKAADGTGSEQTLLPHQPDPVLPSAWSPDGRTLAFTSLGRVNEIYLVTKGEAPRLFESDASAPVFSPDGRWIAYASPAVGNSHVFVRAVNGPGKWQVSLEEGGYLRWRGDGRELFYIGTGRDLERRPLLAVPIAPGNSFRAGPPRVVLPDLSPYMTTTAPQLDWDVTPSGDRFAFLQVERGKDEGARIDVALHWGRHLATSRSGRQ